MQQAPPESSTQKPSERDAQGAPQQHHGAAAGGTGLRAEATSFRPGGGGGGGAGGASAAAAGPAVGGAPSPAGRPANGGRSGSGGRSGRSRGGLSRELSGRSGGGGGGAGSAAGGGGAPRPQQHPHSRDAQVPEAAPASAGVMGSSPGRRSYMRADHLLGFQGRREPEGGSGGRGGGGRGRGGRGGRSGGPPRRPAPKPQPYDRNKFLQANFRFLVSDAVDARRFGADPDRMLEWDDVVQVEMLAPQPVRCPITLEERPLCPQITPCGHVFSFPAIVGHLVTHGGPELRKSAPCPLCYTQIAARELRLVQVHRVAAPAAGQPATFTLLRRPKDSIIPTEAAGSSGSSGSSGSGGGGSPRKGGKGRTPAAGSSGSGGGDAAARRAWAAAGGGSAGAAGEGGSGGGGGPAAAPAGSHTACNRFSKFTLVSGADATQLWVAEAQRLARHAAQVTAEGGLEAAFEAPNVYTAIDALAARARAAAERRQRLLLEAADPMAQDALLSPEEVGAAAAQAVKGATTATLSAAAVRREQAAVAAARDQAFPSLAAAAAPRAASPPPRRRPPAVAATVGQEAFSDDESAGPEEAAAGARSASTGAAAPAGPRTGAVPIAGAGASEAAGAAELSSSQRSAGGLLGGSPADGEKGSSDFFFYQSQDGQWLFLCPLNLRMLLSHFGSYAACPPAITAKMLELEGVVQDEASRRRMRVLGHLPLTATFQLCEVDLGGVLPPEALAPFSDELAAREKRRVQRAKAEARRVRQERAAAAAAAAAAANTGLSAAELRAMPLPSASLLPSALDREVAEDAAAGAAAADAADAEAGGEAGSLLDQPDESPPPPPQPGVSFAAIARDGFAATGPTLGQPGAAGGGAQAGGSAAPAAVAARGAWGPKPASPAALPAWGLGAAAGPSQDATVAQLGGLQLVGKGKKGKTVLLLGGPQRKY